jgi:hypothetical protein
MVGRERALLDEGRASAGADSGRRAASRPRPRIVAHASGWAQLNLESQQPSSKAGLRCCLARRLSPLRVGWDGLGWAGLGGGSCEWVCVWGRKGEGESERLMPMLMGRELPKCRCLHGSDAAPHCGPSGLHPRSIVFYRPSNLEINYKKELMSTLSSIIELEFDFDDTQ